MKEGTQYMIDVRGNPVERGTHEATLAEIEKKEAGVPPIDREEAQRQLNGWREEYRARYKAWAWAMARETEAEAEAERNVLGKEKWR